MKNFDFKKAFDIIESKKDIIEEASMGMHEDWFWTAETVFEKGEYNHDLQNNAPEYHLRGSQWATPVLILTYTNGQQEAFETSTGETELSPSEIERQKSMWVSGCLSGPAQDNIPPINNQP